MSTRPKRKALFLDRDGVINELIYRGEDFLVGGKKARHTAPHRFHEFKFKAGVHEIVPLMKKKGFLCILVTNQPDIKYGLLSQEVHDQVMTEVGKLPFDDIYICFHTRHEGCHCKKPKPGMLLDAAKKWNIDLQASFIVGDTENDASAGRAANCTTIIVDQDYNASVVAHYRIKDLYELPPLIEELS